MKIKRGALMDAPWINEPMELQTFQISQHIGQCLGIHAQLFGTEHEGTPQALDRFHFVFGRSSGRSSSFAFLILVQPGAGGLDGGVEFLAEEFAGWKGGEIFGDVDAGLPEFEQLDLLFLFTCAEDDAEG